VWDAQNYLTMPGRAHPGAPNTVVVASQWVLGRQPLETKFIIRKRWEHSTRSLCR